MSETGIPEWKDVHFICHSGAHLTKRELRAFGEDIVEVIKRYCQPEDKLPPTCFRSS